MPSRRFSSGKILNMAELEEAELKLSRCFERQKRGKISLSERKKNRNI